METTRHSLMDNSVQVYMRTNSPHWQCSCSIDGKQRRTTTKEESLSKAKDIARDWYLGLMGKYKAGELKNGITFRKASEKFVAEYSVINEGERHPRYIKSHTARLNMHLLPFFGNKIITEITPGLVQEYRAHRMSSKKHPKTGEPLRPARTTLHHEIITLRHVLKTANRHGWLPFFPDLSSPYKASNKVTHRAWFSPDEYKQFYAATRERAKNPRKARWRLKSENFHDYTLFMVNTGLRPDEAGRLELRDVAIVTDKATGERILEIAVRGKRGTGWCKSMPGAVLPFERMVKRNNLQPKDIIFGLPQDWIMNSILNELDLKFDREGNRRTSYSFRHTYISFRLLEGADIYQVAKNCRTSVDMIERHYAAHIKDTIDTAAVNVRKKRA